MPDADWPCPEGRPWGWAGESVGLGDTVEKILTATGIGPAYKKLRLRLTGRPCRCGKRRRRLNQRLAYRAATRNP